MKILIAVNHSYPHVGGCEVVTKHIAESLVKDYGHQVTIISGTTQREFEHNKVSYIGMHNTYKLFSDYINSEKFDHLFVYSDYFKYWNEILNNFNSIKTNVSIALVGMNQMLAKRELFNKFRTLKDKIKVITHSNNYIDYKMCNKYNISVSVIPNGIDIEEFNSNYSVVSSRITKEENSPVLLNVANFFPGKGQDHIIKIIEILSKKHDINPTFVQINSKTDLGISNLLRDKYLNLLSQSNKFNAYMFSNLTREQTVAFFLMSDIFLFTSLKEVAPVVILESMAAKTPWISTEVGNVSTLQGGIIIPSGYDAHGNVNFNGMIYNKFAEEISNLWRDRDLYNSLKDKGYNDIVSNYSWKNIVKEYNVIFKKSR